MKVDLTPDELDVLRKLIIKRKNYVKGMVSITRARRKKERYNKELQLLESILNKII